jgi:hypothetical protein
MSAGQLPILGLNRGIVVFLDPYPVGLRKSSGGFARLAAIRRAPSRVSKFAARSKTHGLM